MIPDETMTPTSVDHRGCCASCGKPRYKRYRIARNMLATLLWFVQNPGMHSNVLRTLPRESLHCPNYALLRHWGLLESPERDTYGATDLARQFVRGEVRLWSHIVMEDKLTIVGFNGELIRFPDGLTVQPATQELETGWVE